MVDLDEFIRRYEAVRANEDSKDKINEELLAHVQSLREALQHEKNEVEDKKRLVQVYKEDLRKSKAALDEKNRMEAKLSFVSVLVDGDHMNFLDEFIQDGQKGGRSAAKALIAAARCHVRDVIPASSPNINYKIQVYANVTGLAKLYADTSVVGSADHLREFIRGFNMEDTLCEFVDAGNGNECSDVKINAHFDLWLHDVHCQHIVFCGSADNGYARVLGPHRGSSQISLVEGPPFTRELQEIASEFKTTTFPDVFRPTKLSRRVSFSGRTTTQAITPPRTPTPNYASIARTALPVPEVRSPPGRPAANAMPHNPKLVVRRNVNGERVDEPLRYSRRKVDALRQHKFCNQFQILGSCSYGGSCTYKHEPRLPDEDRNDLMCIARSSACSKGLQCDDERCISGHRCPHNNCTGQGCKFPHNVDTRIVIPL